MSSVKIEISGFIRTDPADVIVLWYNYWCREVAGVF